jgi:hypothetical protein
MISWIEEGSVDDPSILNIELGAKCGNFGKLFFPACYLSDKDEEAVADCGQAYLDLYCDAYVLPWPENRFSKIIMCNPYGYGFGDKDTSSRILEEFGRVLSNGGEVIIIANRINKWGAADKIKKMLASFVSTNGSFWQIRSGSIDCAIEYPEYTFKLTSGGVAFPNERTVLYVTK